jgi:DNA-binding transcriptional LysR family regulator
MYPGIELRLYRYVSVLAKELNFTQAALRLNVSQPTLSKQIRNLEREIDDNPKDRLADVTRPQPAGRRLRVRSPRHTG